MTAHKPDILPKSELTRARVSVRTMVEYVLMSGSLHTGSMPSSRLLDGIRVHQAVQKQNERPEYRSEVSVKDIVSGELVELTVTGRIDGLITEGDNGERVTVEEIKTSVFPVINIEGDGYPVHWAQAMVYAHIWVSQHGLNGATVRLCYYQQDSSDSARFERYKTVQELLEFYAEMTSEYVAYLDKREAWRRVRTQSLLSLAFPFEAYRAGQRNMATHIYYAIKHHKKLFVQAPTGTGKTAAAIFPALKAMAGGHAARLFYLTAKGTQKQAAESALNRMRDMGLKLKTVTLTAREKICPTPEYGCDEALCSVMHGYFDRLKAALDAALAGDDNYNEAAITTLAKRYSLCPFELSLDLCEYVGDLIIGDYNYAFDPRVKLKRFFLERSDSALLVDEAHHLFERAREMFSAKAESMPFRGLRRQIGRYTRRSPLYKALSGVLGAFDELISNVIQKSVCDLGSQSLETSEIQIVTLESPKALYPPMLRFTEVASGALAEPMPYSADLLECFFSAMTFLMIYNEYDDHYRTFYNTPSENSKKISVDIRCMDPSQKLIEIFKRTRGGVLFSATLSPMTYFKDVLGGTSDDATLSLPSPFPPEHLLTLVMPVDTRYHAREKTAADVARAILKLCSARVGNYFACFPSYQYMMSVYSLFEEMSSVLCLGIESIVQHKGMDEDGRQAFLDAFISSPQKTLIGFVVMGGVFGEGIDLPGDRLSGAVIVGVGLPQIGQDRDALRDYYNATRGDGFHYAYVYPGMSKVLQAAGRVIRTASDKGVILLADNRYFNSPYRELLPSYWNIVRTSPQIIGSQLSEFWT